MFGSKRKPIGTGVGVYSSGIKTCLAAVVHATDQRPQVSQCEILAGDIAVTEYIKANNLSHSGCVDVLPLNSYNLMQVDLQGAKGDEKRDAARWQIRELLDYPAEDAVVDLVEVPVIGDEGNSRTYVVAASASSLKSRITELKPTALILDAFDIPEFSLRNLLSLYQNEPRGHGFLWVKEQTSLLVICREDTLFFSRSINLGMDQLHRDAGAGAEGFLSENMQMQLDSIVLEIQRSLDYCESNFHLPPVPKIMVALYGEETELILNYLDRMLQPNISHVDLREILDIPLEIDSHTLNSCLPALGAALRAGGRL